MTTDPTSKDKTPHDRPTSAPLPSAHHAKKRADVLRDNLSKRKQQSRARNIKPADDKPAPEKK